VKQKTVTSAESNAVDPNTLFIMIFSPELELLALVVEQPFAISANAAAVLRKRVLSAFFEEGPLLTSGAEYYIVSFAT
jgi:hypothetical protein